jgi:hypothetical protein
MHYLANDLDTAAFLAAHHFKFLGLEETALDPSHFVFKFSDPEGKGPEAALSFINDAPVPAKSFTDARRHFIGLLKRQKTKTESTDGKRHP